MRNRTQLSVFLKTQIMSRNNLQVSQQCCSQRTTFFSFFFFNHDSSHPLHAVMLLLLLLLIDTKCWPSLWEPEAEYSSTQQVQLSLRPWTPLCFPSLFICTWIHSSLCTVTGTFDTECACEWQTFIIGSQRTAVSHSTPPQWKQKCLHTLWALGLSRLFQALSSANTPLTYTQYSAFLKRCAHGEACGNRLDFLASSTSTLHTPEVTTNKQLPLVESLKNAERVYVSLRASEKPTWSKTGISQGSLKLSLCTNTQIGEINDFPNLCLQQVLWTNIHIVPSIRRLRGV